MEHLYQAIIIAVGFVIVVAVAYTVPKLTAWLRTKVSQAEMEQIIKVTKKLVECAEQTMKAETGEEKKQYVMECLVALGYEITDEIIAFIESAVFELPEKE